MSYGYLCAEDVVKCIVRSKWKGRNTKEQRSDETVVAELVEDHARFYQTAASENKQRTILNFSSQDPCICFAPSLHYLAWHSYEAIPIEGQENLQASEGLSAKHRGAERYRLFECAYRISKHTSSTD